MKFDFKFNEDKRVAVFAEKKIFKENKPILYVYHHEEDGAWEYLTGDPFEEKDIMVVSLEEVVIYDSTINELHNLPIGYYAKRKFVGDKWVRQENKR